MGRLNVHGFVGNAGLNAWDVLGLYTVKECGVVIFLGHDFPNDPDKGVPLEIESTHCSVASVGACWAVCLVHDTDYYSETPVLEVVGPEAM